MMNCENCNIEMIRKTINQKYCVHCNGKVAREKVREAAKKKEMDIDEQFHYVQKRLYDLIEELKVDFSPALVASALISKGVYIAILNGNVADDKSNMNELIVESVREGKEGALRSLKENGLI